jgi:hypothetical protein
MGGPQALARTLNIPLPPGTTDEGIHYVLDNLILPILDEFKPDLILNSAGQDNHYTDPLANMRFSTNGYARLNEKLAPDLCVLEGGYAVETALPYVNTGIIQAMAGLDYSQVREPDFVPGRFVQSAEMVQEIESTVAQVQNIWDERDEMVENALSELGDFYKRRKRVFYDTDMINESQEEAVRICPDCAGYMTIATTAQRGYGILNSAFCISIPRAACSSCRQDAREEFEEHVDDKRIGFVYLQDKDRDTYTAYNNATGNRKNY